ncbi:MAG: hypothetical protein QG629_733 [Patescibacteria group bacterium]|nr:hypothetical protein [Patescibacteria group bacterium]
MSKRKYNILLKGALPLLVFAFLFVWYAPQAHAALPGDDGVIVTTEDTNPSTNSGADGSAVIAVNPDTGSTTTVATNTEGGLISTATVGPAMGIDPTTQTNNEAYAEVVSGEHETVVVNQVTIDVNGNPVTAPKPVATIGSDPDYAEVEDMSYAPDNKNVLVTTYFGDAGGNQVDMVDMTSGNVASVIPPEIGDYYVNAVFGANGKIYFSDWRNNGSDIYVMNVGDDYMSAQNLTNSANADEVLLDISPDVSKALVFNWNDTEEYTVGYYYLDLATGVLTVLNGSGTDLPTAFSASGTYLVGSSENTAVTPTLAAFNAADTTQVRNIRSLKTAFVSWLGENDVFSMAEVAPKLKPVAVTTPQVLGVTASRAPLGAMLEDTGADVAFAGIFAVTLLAAALSVGVQKEKEQN